MVENALARRSRFSLFLRPISLPRRAPIFDIFFDNFLTIFLNTFGTILGSILGPDLPKRDQDEPKRAIRIFKEPKTCIYKKVVFALDCRHFFTLEASQESLKRSKKGPKRHPRSSKSPPKKVWSWTQKLINFSPILEPKLGPKMGPQKPLQKRALLTHPSPTSQGSK